MKVLNLGCGHKVSAHPDVVNIDWSMHLRIRKSRLLSLMAPVVLSEARRQRLARLPPNILAHDLSRGIPFPEGSVDVIFHSNVLEHLDREVAERTSAEPIQAGSDAPFVKYDLFPTVEGAGVDDLPVFCWGRGEGL